MRGWVESQKLKQLKRKEVGKKEEGLVGKREGLTSASDPAPLSSAAVVCRRTEFGIV